MPAYQEEACARIIERRRSLLIAGMGMGSRQVVATAAVRIAARDGVPVQVIDSRAMYTQWLRDFAREDGDPRYVVTPQWVVRHYMLPLEPSDSLTVVHLDSIGMHGTKSYTRIRDYLGWNRAAWGNDPSKAPRMIAIAHGETNVLKRLPLISHLFPVDSTDVIRMGSEQPVDLARLRDAYVKQSVVKPWGTVTPGRGFLARTWDKSKRSNR